MTTAHAGAHAHVNRKEYVIIFVGLLVLTVLEVGVVYVPGIAKGMMISALILMALVKASLVGLFFMHLKHETRVLKLTVMIPMALPAFYAVVLIAEAAWRWLRW
jgi:cytochrome c oxidase subunit IV